MSSLSPAIDIPLWRIVFVEKIQRWQIWRRLPDGGLQMIKHSYSTEGAAKVMAATLNGEVKQQYRYAIERFRRQLP